MRLWHLLLQQVSKSDNPENRENPGSDNSARTKHPINAKYACSIWCRHCGRETYPPDLLSALKTPPTSIYRTKLTPMVRLGNRTYRPENRTNPVNLVLESECPSKS